MGKILNLIEPSTSKISKPGFGMVLLLAFLLGTVLLGTSIELMLVPSVSNFVGLPSQNYMAAQEIAKTGMITVQKDIQTKLNAGTAITTSYTYPVTNVYAPSNPSAMGTLNVLVGSYSATMTSQRGNNYLVKVSATVGSSVATLSKLFTMTRNAFILDTVSGASAAYSTRRLSSTYNGYALRVVSPTNSSSSQDIGFTASGDLDVGALQTFLGATTTPNNVTNLPVDAVPGAIVAFGLRKLRSAYSGYAINVERSSDSTTKDIGFTSMGDLDVPTLMNFVGSGNGYVMTLYDQSGNGYNSNSVPAVHYIVKSGVLQTMNNRPAILFTNSYMGGPASLLPSGHNPRTLNAVYQQTATSGNPTIIGWGQSVNYEQSAIIMNNPNGGFWGYNADGSMTVAPDLSAHTITITYTNPTITDYLDGSAAGGNSPSPTINTPSAQWIYMGMMTGYAPEMIVYASALSTANRQAIELNQSMYYNIGRSPWGYVSTWYDQSGNGKDLTQATTANQPGIVITGLNSRPAVYFNGFDPDYLTNTAMSITTTQVTAFGTYEVDTTNGNGYGRVFSGWKTGQAHDYDNQYSAAFFEFNTSNYISSERNSAGYMWVPINLLMPLQTTTLFDGVNRTEYVTGLTGTSTNSIASTGAFNINNIRIGDGDSLDSGAGWIGPIGEIILYPSLISTANRQVIENDERSYFMTP